MVKNTQEQGVRKVTASDVAQRAGVSKWTVSRAFTEGASISPKALARVLQAAEELGYRPNLLARSLTTRRTNIVGLVVDELGNPNLAMILDEITRQLQRKGYMAMLLNITSEQSYRAAMSLADQFQVDGLIFLGTILSDELLQLARNIGNIPLIVLYRNSDNPDIHVVSTDGCRAGQEIAALMVAQDYERIGYMAGPPSESTQLRRLDGFRDGLAERGKELALILSAEHYQREQGYQSLLHYLDTTPREARIEALFCENDILAIGALEALRVRGEEGRMAIVGFDDIELAASPCYQLTTYRQPLQVLISEAIRRLTADESPSRYLAPGALVLRRSHLRG
ncbi:LacI family DNA-binding transcriptional regulator [Zobellella sp. DQSA1]|uniref:LacI family DNA-binding transcriptional regulator n=1 Tax=Zobellella sp. DQSA1 TaxID=3342386 RepID=UPI0035C154B9